MDVDDIEARIEAELPGAEASVSRPRGHGEGEDAHFAARVVSPAFEGRSLVERHQLVYDAVDEWMTDEIHALEIRTHTPEEYAERGGDEPDAGGGA